MSYLKYAKELSAIDFIRHIAQDYVELSYDKAALQADYYRKASKAWLEHNIKDEEIETQRKT